MMTAAPLAMAAPLAAAQPAATADAAPQAGSATADAAQRQDDNAGIDLVVTGVRRSLKAAIDAKRDADQVSDSISSEDAGKFPTRNIADALQRITGVQVNRNYGEGSTILLRGLPSTMVANLYNGRQLPSPQGARSLDYAILPVDFVKTLTIYKTPTADLPQSGLAGTVNVEPIKPLALGKRTFALNLDGVQDGNTRKIKGGGSIFYADQFFGDTLGIALGFSKNTRAVSRTGFNDFYFEPRSEIAPGGNAIYPNGFDPNHNGSFADTYQLWHYAQLVENVGSRDRSSAVANVQWRPSTTIEVTGDLIASTMHTNVLQTGASARFTNALGGFHGNTVTDMYNDIISGDVDNTWLLYTASNDTLRQRMITGSLDFAWTPTPKLHIRAGGSAGTAKQTENAVTLEGTAYTTMHYDFVKDPAVASWGYANPAFAPMDPNSFYFDHIKGALDRSRVNDTHAYHADLTYDVDRGLFRSIQFGGNFMSNGFHGNALKLNAKNLASIAALTGLPIVKNAYPDGRSAIGAAPFMSVSPIDNPLSTYTGAAQFPHRYLYTDPRKFFAKYSLAQVTALPGAVTRSPAEDARTDETAKAAYVRMNFASGDNRLSGNVGLRYEETRDKSRFFGVDFGKIVYDPSPSCDQVCANSNTSLYPSVLKTQDNVNRQWLPSANLRYALTDKLIGRVAVAREMTRPDLDVMVGGEKVQMLQTPAGGGNPITVISSGNPYIKPYLATGYDASLEWYFNREGLLSAAFFYKDVSNWVFTSLANEVHTIALKQGGTKDYSFVRTLPQNGAGVKVKGLEISYQQPFTFLPGVLSGLGFAGNYTFVDASDIINKATGERTPVTGVSKNSFNASTYYEKYGFNIRLSYNYHQGRIEAVRDYWRRSPVYSKSYGQLDLSSGYSINEHAQLTFSVINLLNKADYIDYMKVGGYINDWNQEGRIVQLGVHVTL